MSHKFKISLCYDGSLYYGWQKQKKESLSIQEILEKTLSLRLNEKIQVVGSGRTDKGVHALKQVAHFKTSKKIEKKSFLISINKLLPSQIQILSIQKTSKNFHALKSKSKIYIYQIYNHPVINPFKQNYYWQIQRPLNLKWLNEASSYLKGRHDFSSFKNRGGSELKLVKEVYQAYFRQKSKYHIEFYIHLDGALKQMIRNILGSLIHLEAKKAKTKEFLRILKACDRSKAFKGAPASGLFLKKVFY